MKNVLILFIIFSSQVWGIGGVQFFPVVCDGYTPIRPRSFFMSIAKNGNIFLAGNAGYFTAGNNCEQNRSIRFFQTNSQGQKEPSWPTEGVRFTQKIFGDADVAGIKTSEKGFITFGEFSFLSDSIYSAQFQANGQLDKSYGYLGRQILSWEEFSVMNDLLILPDGSHILFGQMNMISGTTSARWIIAKLTALGLLDHSFAKNGILRLDFNKGGFQGAGRAVLDNKSRILVAGNIANDNYYIARILKDGSLDETLANAGFFDTRASGFASWSQDLLSLPDGSFLHLSLVKPMEIVLTKYDENGDIVASFGQKGSFKMSLSRGPDYFYRTRLGLSENGDILIATEDGGSTDAEDEMDKHGLVISLSPIGTLNLNFANSGLLKISYHKVTSLTDFAYLNHGFYVAGISGPSGSEGTFYLARFHADGKPDVNFGK